MSDFKQFAERVNEIALDARKQIMDADRELKQAEDYRMKYPRNGGTTPEYLAKAARAEADYRTAIAKRGDLRKVLSDSVERSLISIRQEMESAIEDTFAADPKQIDRDTMTLLESGILRPGEYQRFLDAAIVDKNWTMARLIGNAADKAAMSVAEKFGLTDRAAQELRAVANTAQRLGGTPYLQNMEVLSDVLTRCIKNPGLWPKWEELTAPVIEGGFR